MVPLGVFNQSIISYLILSYLILSYLILSYLRLSEDCKKWDDEREDRLKRGFTLNLTVDHRHHSKIIGRKGAVINKIKDAHKVILINST